MTAMTCYKENLQHIMAAAHASTTCANGEIISTQNQNPNASQCGNKNRL